MNTACSKRKSSKLNTEHKGELESSTKHLTHIFMELKGKAEMADDLKTAKELSAARGDWVLRVQRETNFLKYILEVDYDKSLLLWHIATELCFNDEINKETEEKTGPESDTAKKTENIYRCFAKLLSDYMLYLLVMQPTMMSAVSAIYQIRFRDTCAEAKTLFFKERQFEELNFWEVIGYFFTSLLKYTVFSFIGIILIVLFPALSLIIPLLLIFIYLLFFVGRKYSFRNNITWPNILNKAENYCTKVRRKHFYVKPSELREEQIIACKNIMGVNTEVAPITVKGDRSKSVLFDGCILAKELQKLGEAKWELMSKVWVELLSYAACHCRANAHAQQLSKGGELLTIVWLLMAHFGIGDQFQISEGHERAKLIVRK